MVSLGWLSSAYASYCQIDKQFGNDAIDAPYTTWKIRHDEVCRTIDYIWYQHELLALRQLLAIPPLALAAPDAYPNSAYPSDHLAIGASFQWR
jgi:mRNA deadenylase 3'-5' endonuclease subunit Ccr4